MFDGVDPDTVRGIVTNQIFDPTIQRRDNRRVFRIDVCKHQFLIPQPALLDIGLIVVIGYEALRVEIGLGVERLEVGCELGWVRVADKMVHNDVEHKIHATFVEGGRERLEIIGGAVVAVYVKYIHGPIAMEGFAVRSGALNIGDNWRDPNGVEAHVLYVIEVVRYALPSTAAILLVVGVARWA